MSRPTILRRAGVRAAGVPALARRLARAVQDSRARDDQRGPRVIDDYTDTHPAAADDPCVRAAWEEADRLEAEVAALLATWPARRLPGTAGRERAVPA